MNSAKVVTATFNLIPITYYTLTVATTGTGSGTVIKSPDAISYTAGSAVILTATATAGSTFAGWSGDATGSINPVTVTMNADKVVTATFSLNAGTDTDLAVTENVVRTIDAITYTIVAQNLGPNAANGAVVSSAFSAEISNVTWTCAVAGGAVCGGSGNGNSLADTLTTFPMGGVVTYTVRGQLDMLATGDNIVTITPPSGVIDSNPSNNRAEYKIYRVLLVLVFYNTRMP